MKADYVIRNGRVIDPSNNIDEVRDVVIQNMHIVDAKGQEVECEHIIDASGCIVTPGLIDFHCHVFREGSSISIDPDMMIAQGTTAAVDAGSAGTSTYEAFHKSVIENTIVRLKTFLTVYGGGQLDPKLCEDFNPELYNLEKTERLVDKYRNEILGFKIRISRGVVPDEKAVDYLKYLVDLADKMNDKLQTELRVCVHTTNSPVEADKLAEVLRTGDIFCHCYQGVGNTILEEDGTVREGIRKAREKGVIFDAANGKGNFGIAVAQKALKDGFFPDIISSDLTVDKFNMPPYAKNLPTVLSKYLTMGMKLSDVIRAATVSPAQIMRMEKKIGTLSSGAYADVSVFKLKKIAFEHKDWCDDVLPAKELLVPQMTLCAGEIQYCQNDFYLENM